MTPRFSVVSGGVACVVSAALFARAFPALLRYDSEAAERALRAEGGVAEAATA